MSKELFVSIMEKHLKEMEVMTENKCELILDNDLKNINNLEKSFTKKVKNRLAYL